MIHFSDLLAAARVRAALPVRDKTDLVERLSGLLADDGDAAVVREALAARERLGTTALGHGVAIPHGRSAEIREARAAFVRLAEPIEFGADDGRPVDLIAALVVPAHFTDQHLKLLAELAELFSDTSTTAALRSAPDADTLLALLRRAVGAGG
ncbi:MAG TPA: PTS sugar transporter subunit IIA [Dokdonella sp.]